MTEPPSDPRIEKYREATRRLARGEFSIDVPIGQGDPLGGLGQEILHLSRCLEDRYSKFRELSELATRVSSALLVTEVLDHVFESFQSMIPYDRIGLALVEDEGRLVRSVYARSHSSTHAIPIGYSAPLEGSSLVDILATGRPRIINDTLKYLEEHPDSESTRRIVADGIRSSLTCPLLSMGHPVGFLFFSSQRPETYEEGHIGLFLEIAGQMGAIIEKSKLYEDLLRTKQELEEANQKLARLAAIDGLTSLYNRRSLEERLEEEWGRAGRSSEPLSMILLDIDHFKRFNDSNGHLVGDDCLRAVAATLVENLHRRSDFVARFGGEEFAILLPGVDRNGAREVAERIRLEIESLAIPHQATHPSETVSISLGVATRIPRRGERPEQLTAAADAALYRAKDRGRNQVAIDDGEDRADSEPHY